MLQEGALQREQTACTKLQQEVAVLRCGKEGEQLMPNPPGWHPALFCFTFLLFLLPLPAHWCMPRPEQPPSAVAAGASRQQLKRSEELRQRGQRALDELKQEFEALQRDLFDGAGAAGIALALSPGGPGSCWAGSPLASTPGEPGTHSERLADLLGR